MPLLSNQLRLGAAAASSGDDTEAYQIEKSLRFDDDSKSYLSSVHNTGNRRTWTWSGWVKRSDLGEDIYLFAARDGSSQPNSGFRVKADGSFYWLDQDASTNYIVLTSTPKYKDPSAWYHFVVAVDTTQSVESERVKIYTNGVSTIVTGTYPSQNYENTINKNIEHTINRRTKNDAGKEYGDGCLADVHFIDGLQLSPAAFGSFDDSKCWNPKALSLPAPNANKTWSGMVTSETGTFENSGSPANLFDNNPTTTGVDDTNQGKWVKFTPTDGLAFSNRIRVYNNGQEQTWEVKLTDGTIKETKTDSAAYHTIYEGGGTLEYIKDTAASGDYNNWFSVEVDGVSLIDGATDTSTFSNPNDGRSWSTSGTLVNTQSGTNNGSIDGAFNGSLNSSSDDNYVQCNDNSSNPSDASYTFAGSGVPFEKLEVAAIKWGGDVKVNDVNINAKLQTNWADPKWVDITSLITSPMTKLTYQGNSSQKSVFFGIKVNGVELLDGVGDNSFHLKFNDTARNTNLGKDRLNGKIEDATGGLPIYNTTDDFGEVKGSGNRTDSDSSNLKLAIAGDAFTDSSGNSVNVSATNATISTDESRFYGSSIRFDGTDDYITTGTGLWSANGDATFEAWLWIDNFSEDHTIMHTADAASGDSANDISIMTDKQIRIHPASANAHDTGSVLAAKQWFHLAVVQSSSTRKVYINGIDQAMSAVAGNGLTSAWNEATETMYIGEDNMRNSFDGYMQDIRVYDKQKYTANFQPPTRNDFTVNNLTSDIKLVNTAGSLSGSLYSGSFDNVFAPLEVAAGAYSASATAKWTFSTAMPITGTVRVKVCHGSSSTTSGHDLLVVGYTDSGGSSQTVTIDVGPFENANPGWITLSGSHTWTNITYFDLQYTSGGQGSKLRRVEMGGKEIVNSGSAATKDAIDVPTDSPTNYGTESNPAVGGEVQGNYCTLNPLFNGGTLSEGNLKFEPPSWDWTKGTLGVTEGKWYFELIKLNDGGDNCAVGWGLPTFTNDSYNMAPGGMWTSMMIHSSNQGKTEGGSENASAQTYGNTWHAAGTCIGVALDFDNKAMYFAHNNTWQNSGDPTSGSSKTGAVFHQDLSAATIVTPLVGGYGNTGDSQVNFGQRAFKYTAPSGYKSLCTQNLDDTFSGAELNNPSKYFGIKKYLGNDSTQTIKGLKFQPDLVWILPRDYGVSRTIWDVVRGTTKALYTDMTSGNTTLSDGLTAFNSDGFTLGGNAETNKDAKNWISWAWDAGTAAATVNTSGDIDASNAWVNATAGLNILQWTGNGNDNQTLGHNLGAKPDFMMIKRHSQADDWIVYHNHMTANDVLYLNKHDSKIDSPNVFEDTEPTNNLVTLGSDGYVNANTNTYIGYLWTAIPGYSAFGSYEGNGANDGTFVHLGFRPALVIVKNIDANAHWNALDNVREPYNLMTAGLYTSDTPTETDGGYDKYKTDHLSNGFKHRGDDVLRNASNTYIYAAWAEHPFKTARGK